MSLFACVQHEALVNEAFEGRQVTGLCLYDASRLGDDVLADARATHPLLWSCGSLHRSADYAPDDVLARCNQPLPANPGAVTYMVRKSADLRPARSFAVNYAGWVGLSQDGIEDLQLVATELATNSLMYTDGACRLAFWRDDDHLVCEARDSGRIDDPLVGRLDPGPAGPASRGLFLVNAISDLVRTHTTSSRNDDSGIPAAEFLRRPDQLNRKAAHREPRFPAGRFPRRSRPRPPRTPPTTPPPVPPTTGAPVPPAAVEQPGKSKTAATPAAAATALTVFLVLFFFMIVPFRHYSTCVE